MNGVHETVNAALETLLRAVDGAPPLPTPYDITPLPRFPYEARLQDWLILFLVAGLCAFALWMWGRRRQEMATATPIAAVARELRALLARPSPELASEEIAYLSMLLRRLCGWRLSADLAAASTRELQAARDQARSPALQRILAQCLDIEGQKYMPPEQRKVERRALAPILDSLEELGRAEGEKG